MVANVRKLIARDETWLNSTIKSLMAGMAPVKQLACLTTLSFLLGCSLVSLVAAIESCGLAWANQMLL